MNLLLITFLTALTVALATTPIVRTLARRYGAVDRPDGRRKLQRRPVPLGGGIAVYFAFCTSLFVAFLLRTQGQSVPCRLTAVLAISTGLLALVGMLDDAFDLRACRKLLLQFMAASPVVLAGFFPTQLTFFGYVWSAGWLAAPLVLVWLVACINAVNMLDGLDGFASVVGIMIAATVCLVSLGADNPASATAAVALAGGLLGFLRYNFPPATIYLGDTGSMMTGLVLGSLALLAPDATGKSVSCLVLAVIMAVPLWDMVVAIVRRTLKRMSVGVADREHLHHRLIARGFSNLQALIVVACCCLVSASAVFLATFWRAEVTSCLVVVGLFGALASLRIFGHAEIQLARHVLASNLPRRVGTSGLSENTMAEPPTILPITTARATDGGETELPERRVA